MKKIFFVLALLIGSTLGLYAQDASASVERDQMVSLDGTYRNGVVFFKLLMKNETGNGFYSMVKYHANGEYTSVGVRSITANTIDQPLLYSFTDKDINREEVTYVLVRITDKKEEVGRWKFFPAEGTLCPDEVLAER